MVHDIEKRKKASILLANYFKCSTNELYYKYQMGEFPDNGKIADNVFFYFHGLGCSVKNEKENWGVSLEFGPNGQAIAIDRGTILYLCKEAYDENDITPSELIEYLLKNNIIKLANQELYDYIRANSDLFNLKSYPVHTVLEPMEANSRLEWSSEEEEIDATVADRFVLVTDKLTL